jgi:hypothetical protein
LAIEHHFDPELPRFLEYTPLGGDTGAAERLVLMPDKLVEQCKQRVGMRKDLVISNTGRFAKSGCETALIDFGRVIGCGNSGKAIAQAQFI